MTLDKSKKYEFAGDVYVSSKEAPWISGTCPYVWGDYAFQHFADKGLVKEVREPIVGRGRVAFDPDGYGTNMSIRYHNLGLTVEQAAGRTFDIVATEVVE